MEGLGRTIAKLHHYWFGHYTKTITRQIWSQKSTDDFNAGNLRWRKEEGKVRTETKKILGKLNDGKIDDADIRVSCTCTRVPVIDGHTESVFVETEKEIDPSLAKETYNGYNKEISVAGLPSAPEQYYAFHEDPTRPQPRMEREVGDGMTTTIGRVEKEELFENGLKYVLFSHNKKMGSAKGAVLLAEMLYKKNKI